MVACSFRLLYSDKRDPSGYSLDGNTHRHYHFNVILLNEFPDYEADKATGKKNLLYRLGKKVEILFTSLSLCWLQ